MHKRMRERECEINLHFYPTNSPALYKATCSFTFQVPFPRCYTVSGIAMLATITHSKWQDSDGVAMFCSK